MMPPSFSENDQQIIIHLSKVIEADATPKADATYKVSDEVNAHKAAELQAQFLRYLTGIFP